MHSIATTTHNGGKQHHLYSDADPHQLADRYLSKHKDGCKHLTLRYWRGEFWRFSDGRYWAISHQEIKAKLNRFIATEFRDRKPTNKAGVILKVTSGLVNDTLQALQGKTLIEGMVEQPIWLGSGPDGPFFVFKNRMVRYGQLESPFSLCGDRHHCSAWFSQTAFPYDYDPQASCPRWSAFLNEVLEGDEERIALLQEWFGYCLVPDTQHQKFVVVVGEGQNGKSVVLDVLTGMLGPENVGHVPVEVFGDRFQLTTTLGKLANISFDTGAMKESAEATIKAFTAGDRMYFDRKGTEGVFAYPTARLILATNQDPRFGDRSKGIWRRMIVLPFRVNIPPERQDPQLSSKLKAELPGIFNWAIEGLKRLRRDGQFMVPTMCDDVRDQFRRESNPAGEFLKEHYEPGAAADLVPCSEVYDHYKSWCTANGVKYLDATNLGKELRKVHPQAERLRTSKGDRGYYYGGLRRVDVHRAVSSDDGQGLLTALEHRA